MEVYKAIIRDVLANGVRKQNRTGIDTLSIFGLNYEIDLSGTNNMWPLMTLRELPYKVVFAELAWFLSGDPKITELKKYTKIWNPWADEHDAVPSPYGFFWRGKHNGVDQIAHLIKELRENPNSRRMVVTAWDPANALGSKLPPCHMMFTCGVTPNGQGGNNLNLHLFQRSCDIGIGLPWDVASYTALMHLLCKVTGLWPGKFVYSISDAHIYVNHEDNLRQLLQRAPKEMPTLEFNFPTTLTPLNFDFLTSYEALLDAAHVGGYYPWPAMKFDVAV